MLLTLNRFHVTVEEESLKKVDSRTPSVDKGTGTKAKPPNETVLKRKEKKCCFKLKLWCSFFSHTLSQLVDI